MKDFDAVRTARIGSDEERSFKILGEVFIAKASVKPEVLTKYENLEEAEGAQTTLEIIDELVLSMIQDGAEGEEAEARYRAIRAREDDPIALADLQNIVEWLVERQTGRPTGKPGNSSAGRGRTGGRSTADSSSPVRAVG